MILSDMVGFSDNDELHLSVLDSKKKSKGYTIFEDGYRVDAVGGFYHVDKRDIFVKETQNTVFVQHLHQSQSTSAANAQYEPMCFNMTTRPTPSPSTNPTSRFPSKSTEHTVFYNTSGNEYAWLRSSVGAGGLWAAELSSMMKQEFSSGEDFGADVPLLQPLWGTLEAFTDTGLPASVLSGPPRLPTPPGECVKGSAIMKPLVVLPARWTPQLPTNEAREDESGMPILAVPPAVPLNVLSMAAQALAFSGPMSGTTPTFRVPIFSTGIVADVLKAVKKTSGNVTTTKGQPWGLLGVRSAADAHAMFRAALIEDGASGRVELQIVNNKARVERVRPTCAGKGGCAWCDEMTVAIPLLLRAGAGGRVLDMTVWVSVTEIVCSTGGVAPRIADSLAAAVHLGTLMGAEKGVTHVVVLGENHVVHTLARKGGDRQFYRDVLLGGKEGGVGHTFLEQVLGAWSGSGGTCRGPRAVQAIVVGANASQGHSNATSAAALHTPLSDLRVDHHGVMFEAKTVSVPSWPMTTTQIVGSDSGACFEDYPCVRMQDMVSSIFHPFTTLEGVVGVQRWHLLPMKTRKVLGVVDPAEVHDVLQEGAAVTRGGHQVLEPIDGVSPLAVCVEARSFAQVNGLYGRAGGRWVATVEDVAGALRSRIVPVVMQHRKHLECATGVGGVVGAALRVLRVVTRQVVGYSASHAGGEEAVVGWRLSSGLRHLSTNTPHQHAPATEYMDERLTLAQLVVRRAPLVAASARVVRMSTGVRVQRDVTAIDEATLGLLLTPRFVHIGDSQNSGFNEPAEKEGTEAELAESARRVSRALYRIVAGVPTSVCVPSGLLHAVKAHANAMEGVLSGSDVIDLQERLQGEYSPWRHAQCSNGEEIAVCIARAHLRHMQQMLECDSMGEWLRRLSDDMRVLPQPNKSTTTDTASPANRLLEKSITQATTLGAALCQRWRCSWNTTSSHNVSVEIGGAAYIDERQQHHNSSEMPGADADMTRTVGLGDLSNIQLGADSVLVTFLQSVLLSPTPDVISAVSIGHTLQSRIDLCPIRSACAPFNIRVMTMSIVGPLTLWQQWALRYVRMLLQTPVPSSVPPLHRLKASATSATNGHSLIRALSGHDRLFDGQWSDFAWESQRARTQLSLDYAVSRFIPGGDLGSGPGAAALTSLVTTRSLEAADMHMKTALRHLSTTELTMMLRKPLLTEALQAAQSRCNGHRRTVNSPMPVARAVVRNLRGRSWDAGPDSLVDFVDRAKERWLDCALRGLSWLESGRDATGPGVVERELYSWLSKNGAPQNTTATTRLSFMFARDLQCKLPPTNITTHPGPDLNMGTLSAEAVDLAYTYLLSIVRHRAFDLLDTSSSIESIFNSTAKSSTFCSSQKASRGAGHALSFDRTALHWHIPCFHCSGFMTEIKGYLPSLIEDKGLPMSLSYKGEFCLCNKKSAAPSHPQNLYRRSLLTTCDTDGCNPTYPSSSPFYAPAHQRHYRGYQPDGSTNGRAFAIWIDYPTPERREDPKSVADPFIQADRVAKDRRFEKVMWSRRGAYLAPLDHALVQNLFTAYNNLGEAIRTPVSHIANISSSDHGSDAPSTIVRRSTRGHRICRYMYEADRIYQHWVGELSDHCDEIWAPSNWGKRIIVNSVVRPLMELAFVPRVLYEDDSGTFVCMGCVDLAASESSYLLPPTTAYQPVSLDVDALRTAADLKLEDDEVHIEGIQRRVASDDEKHTLLSQMIDGLRYQALEMVVHNDPVIKFIDKEAYVSEVVSAMANYSVTVENSIVSGQRLICQESTCRPALVIGMGNSTHQLAYRVHLKTTIPLSKIVVMPESIDIHNMDPVVASPIDMIKPKKKTTPNHPDGQDVPAPSRPGLFQPGDESYGWERWCSRKCFRGQAGNRRFIRRDESFRFISVFKWENRKGWRQLMEAYYSAFYGPLYTNRTSDKEPMLIVVGKPHIAVGHPFTPVYLSTKLVDDWLQNSGLPVTPPDEKPSLGRSDFPCTCFVTSSPSDADLISLYRSVDAFLITTRGEGWGLPISEAMAMGLPTITTDWGGSTEFTSQGSIPIAINATRRGIPATYPVNATTVELSSDDGFESNMRMAAVSIPHTVEVLRQVYKQPPEVNQEVGRRARETIVHQFSQASTTDLMTVRLAAIAHKLRCEPDDEGS